MASGLINGHDVSVRARTYDGRRPRFVPSEIRLRAASEIGASFAVIAFSSE